MKIYVALVIVLRSRLSPIRPWQLPNPPPPPRRRHWLSATKWTRQHTTFHLKTSTPVFVDKTTNTRYTRTSCPVCDTKKKCNEPPKQHIYTNPIYIYSGVYITLYTNLHIYRYIYIYICFSATRNSRSNNGTTTQVEVPRTSSKPHIIEGARRMMALLLLIF